MAGLAFLFTLQQDELKNTLRYTACDMLNRLYFCHQYSDIFYISCETKIASCQKNNFSFDCQNISVSTIGAMRVSNPPGKIDKNVTLKKICQGEGKEERVE